MKRNVLLSAVLLVLVVFVAACSPKETAKTEGPASDVVEAILTVGDKDYTLDQLKALGSQSADHTDKEEKTTTYTGTPLVALLNDAGLSGNTLVLTAADGYESDMDFAEALACDACIVALDDPTSLRTIMPGMSNKLHVRDLVKISAK